MPGLIRVSVISEVIPVLTKFRENRMAMLGGLFLLFLMFIAIFADLIAPYDPRAIDLLHTYAPPSGEHLLGTDALGRDVLSRLIYGTRISLSIGFSATLFTVLLGTLLGSLAGYFGGKLDQVIMRAADLTLNFPFILLVLTLMAILEEINLFAFVVIIALTSWPGMTRIIRGLCLRLREQEFILAAKALGSSPSQIMLKHFLPNLLFPIITQASLTMATMIMIESGLSFLGFGVAEPTPTWGNMIYEAQSMLVLKQYPHLWIPPGLAILCTVLAIHFIGDGLRQATDPRFMGKG